jgi:hypothetical protein
MKNKINIFIVTSMFLLLLIVNIKFIVNLLLNKKYVVDEIIYTDRKEGLEGIQEIISKDYLFMFYFNIFFIIILTFMFIYFLIWRKKNKTEQASPAEKHRIKI